MVQAIVDRTESVTEGRPEPLGPLRVFPITGASHDQPVYRLLDGDTIDAVEVTEVSEDGSVPTLRVSNGLDEAVFLMDGQELVGAKQNRILNTDVIVDAKTELKVPVSCVEAGRWGYRSRRFTPGKMASHRTRYCYGPSVHDALRSKGKHEADQAAVWQEVEESLDIAECVSPTSSLHDAYEARRADLEAARKEIVVPPDAIGLAVFHRDEFLGLDIFDRHSTLMYFWESLIDSYTIDWIAMLEDLDNGSGEMVHGVVERVCRETSAVEWEPYDSPGLGRDYRLPHEHYSGAALVWEKVLIHLQVFPRRGNGHGGDERDVLRPRPRIRRRYMPGEPRTD